MRKRNISRSFWTRARQRRPILWRAGRTDITDEVIKRYEIEKTAKNTNAKSHQTRKKPGKRSEFGLTQTGLTAAGMQTLIRESFARVARELPLRLCFHAILDAHSRPRSSVRCYALVQPRLRRLGSAPILRRRRRNQSHFELSHHRYHDP